MIIDAHIHITPDGRWFNTPLDASLKTALSQMDRAGVEMACLIPWVGQTHRSFAETLLRDYPDRFMAGFTIASLADEELRELNDWLDSGAATFVKVHPRATGIEPLAPELGPFLDAAERAGRPVIFDSYIRGSRVPLERISPFRYDELATARPGLKIVLAHAGGHRPLDALAVAQTHPNVHLEISHVLGYYKGSSLEADHRFILERLDQKIIYGSDYPEFSIDGYLKLARTMTAPPARVDLDSFLGNNWRRLIHAIQPESPQPEARCADWRL